MSEEKEDTLNIEHLKSILHYDRLSGLFYWLKKPIRYIKKDKPRAGCINKGGYTQIGINGKQYLAHRLAWFYASKKWPKKQIDHINGIKSDNRLTNLREATRSQNHYNTKSHKGSSSKFVGVSFCNTTQKYVAVIMINKKIKHLGLFKKEEDAAKAYDKVAYETRGNFANLNFTVCKNNK